MLNPLEVEVLCEMERRERETAYADPKNPAIKYVESGPIQTDLLIALLKGMKKALRVKEADIKSKPVPTFSSRSMVIKKVNKNE